MTGPIGGGLANPNASHSSNGRTIYNIREVAWIAGQFWKTAGGIIQLKGNPQVIATAIAMAESGGNIMAHNNKGSDDSYGLWQINMLGGLGPDRRRQYNLKTNEDLFDPIINAKVAFGESNLGTNWRPWSVYNDGKYLKWMGEAQDAVNNPLKPGNVGQGKVNTQFTPWEAFKDWIGGGMLRIGGFVGGSALLIGAAVLVSKKGVK